MLRITEIGPEKIQTEEFGGKAVGLYLLCQCNLLVPQTLLISADINLDDLDDDSFRQELKLKMAKFNKNGHYNLAVRSSSTIEDSFSDSKAGHYKSILGNMTWGQVLDSIREVIESQSSTEDPCARMGVIIQEKIDADYSGVIFSSNPLNYSRKEMIISCVAGIGEELVSGSVSGQDIVVTVRDGEYKLGDGYGRGMTALPELCRQSKQLEKTLGYPIDIEWAVCDGTLYFLQCRPLTSITKIHNTISQVTKEGLADIPNQLIDHDKIQLRLFAQQHDRLISDAYVHIFNGCHPALPQISGIKKSAHCKGYSCVITYPRKLSNKVVRSFVGDSKNVTQNITDCCRYGIRSYPPYADITKCLETYEQMVLEDYWVGATIIQEIFAPRYTGIIQKNGSNFIMEITRGHFLTKGIVPTSQYMVDKDGNIILKKETDQYTWFEIIEGHVIRCICNDGDTAKVELFDDNIRYTVRYFEELLESNAEVIEFGLLEEDGGSHIQPYLIDFVNSDEDVSIAATDISEGIISRGRITGRILHLDTKAEDSLDIHFHDECDEGQQLAGNTIIFCEKPDISVLSVINRYNPRNVGCVFSDGSMLCHLAVILRERGIPAVRIGAYSRLQYPDGAVCMLDAESKGLAGRERLIIEK